MALNTRIRGEQLLLDDVTIGVDSNKIEVKDGGIAALQLATDAVETLKIKDENVTLAKLADFGLEAHILVGNASLRPVSVAISGDISIIADGTVAIASDVIINADVKSDAAIAESKLNLDYATHDNATDHTSGSETMVGDVGGTVGANTIGATKVLDSMINDDVATGLAGVGLSASSGVMAVDLNELTTEATFDVAADYVGIVDATDSGSDKTLWSVIATAIAGSGLTATNGVLSADAVTDNIIEADILFEDESANCNGSNTTFTLDSTPVTNSVQVFLNGLLQQEGSGKDYTLTGTTVEFATAPETIDILLIHYVRND